VAEEVDILHVLVTSIDIEPRSRSAGHDVVRGIDDGSEGATGDDSPSAVQVFIVNADVGVLSAVQGDGAEKIKGLDCSEYVLGVNITKPPETVGGDSGEGGWGEGLTIDIGQGDLGGGDDCLSILIGGLEGRDIGIGSKAVDGHQGGTVLEGGGVRELHADDVVRKNGKASITNYNSSLGIGNRVVVKSCKVGEGRCVGGNPTQKD
jgi:hypothetical protein